MKSRDVIGKTIIKVNQKRRFNKQIDSFVVELFSLEFSDGSRIVFIAQESESEPYVESFVVKPVSIRS